MKNNFIKSLLFIPGHKKNFLENLKYMNSDALAIDLEDAVPINQKKQARKNLESLNVKNYKNKLYVRLNNDTINLVADIKSSL